eukprot:403374372
MSWLINSYNRYSRQIKNHIFITGQDSPHFVVRQAFAQIKFRLKDLLSKVKSIKFVNENRRDSVSQTRSGGYEESCFTIEMRYFRSHPLALHPQSQLKRQYYSFSIPQSSNQLTSHNHLSLDTATRTNFNSRFNQTDQDYDHETTQNLLLRLRDSYNIPSQKLRSASPEEILRSQPKFQQILDQVEDLKKKIKDQRHREQCTQEAAQLQ